MNRLSSQLRDFSTSLVFGTFNVTSKDLEPSILKTLNEYGLSRLAFYNLIGYALKNNLGNVLDVENTVKQSIRNVLLRSDVNPYIIDAVHQYLITNKTTSVSLDIEKVFGIKTTDALSKFIAVCMRMSNKKDVQDKMSELFSSNVLTVSSIKYVFNGFMESLGSGLMDSTKADNAYKGKEWDTP